MDGTIIPSATAARLPRSVPILVRTNIGTNISFTASEKETVRELKRRVVMEHANIHPDVGDIQILHLKVKWGKSLFSLSDSMSVRDAFHWKKGAWILYVDASSATAARDMVATSADIQMDANGGEHTSSFKVACKELNADALDNHVSVQCKDQGISFGKSKSPDYKHHQEDPSISMDNIIEPSNDILISEERVQASRNMDGPEMTTASVAVEIDGNKSNIHSISVSATELADPFSELQQNPTQTKQIKGSRKSSKQCAASENNKGSHGLINSSIAGITDFNILEKSNSRIPSDSPWNDEVAEIPTIPEGSNLDIPPKRKKKSSRSQTNLNVQHGMIDISATHEIVSDTKKLVEISPSLSEPMNKKQCLSPRIDSLSKAKEKSKDMLLSAGTVDCVSGNLLDDMDMLNDSDATKRGGNSSNINTIFFETVGLADQSDKPQKNDIHTKKKKKSIKYSEQSAPSEGTNQSRLSNLATTAAIDSQTVEIPHFADVPDSLLDVNTLSRGRESPSENLKVEHSSGKQTGTPNVEEVADISQNPEEAHLEVPHKRKRKSSSHQKKTSSHGMSHTASAAPEIVNHAKLAPGECAATLSYLAAKKQQQNEPDNEILEATNASTLELEKEPPPGIQVAGEISETDDSMKDLSENQMQANTHMLGKAGVSHEKFARPLLDKTPLVDESNFLLALPVSTEKQQQRKRKKSGNAIEACVYSLEPEKGYANIEFPEGVSDSHDKQSNGLSLERAPDDFRVDGQNCSSVLLDKSAASSAATAKKLQRKMKKNKKFEAETMKSSQLRCFENQDTEEILEANCLNKGLDSNAKTKSREVNESHDEKYDALPLMDKTPNCDPAGEVRTDGCSELQRASIGKSVFMEIFSPQEHETSLIVEENPSALSGHKKSTKALASRTFSRKSNARKEGSKDTLMNHSQRKHKKKSRLDKLSDHEGNSDGSTRQENLQKENTEKRSEINDGIFPADGELDTKPTPPNNGRRQIKSLLSKVDSPISSGENTGIKGKGHCSMDKENDSYPGQTHGGVTSNLKIAAPSFSSASTEDDSPTNISHFRVAVRKNHHEMSGRSSRAAGQDEIFSARDMLFDDFNNVTSENEHGADNPAANLGSELNNESQQEIQFTNSQVIDHKDSSSMKNIDMKNRSGKNSMGSRQKGGQSKLSAMLRNTRAYKKASVIIASPNQELEVDSECPDLFPESQY